MVDFLSHILWGYVFFHSFADWPLYILFGLLPDIIFGVPSLFVMIKLRKKLKWRFPHEEASKLPEFALVRRVYWSAHSLVLIFVLIALALVFVPQLAAPIAGGMLLHFALDIFTHRGGMAGQKPLYPMSDYRITGFTHWSNRRFLILHYWLLAFALALVLFKVI